MFTGNSQPRCFGLLVRQITWQDSVSERSRGHWLSAVPSALTLVMIAMAMPAAIKAYSTAVAADASFKNLASKFNETSCDNICVGDAFPSQEPA